GVEGGGGGGGGGWLGGRGVVGVAIIVLVSVGVSWGLRPLGRLTRQLGQVTGDGAGSRRFDEGEGARELAPVRRALNQMLDRVHATVERERAFAGAAAHELRTPLAELRTTLEVAQRWPDPARAAASLHECMQIGAEMERLVESLLLMSRARNGEVGGHDGGSVALGPLVEVCLHRHEETIIARHLQVDNVLNGAVMHGHKDAVEVIVRNLVDNAVRYTPDGGRISIVPLGEDGFRVENWPVTLRREEVPDLFTPFFRRAETAGWTTGAGLGLSVVEQVSRASGLRVEADVHDGAMRVDVVGAPG
ncbi:MAG: HAMP domain-containing protein, partial [Phycisphaerales bacterium]|nr:HAMP domain-containing protein [Phycisphaerales bacterium]